MWAMYYSVVMVMCLGSKSLGMNAYRVDDLVITGSVLVAVLLSVDDGLRMAEFKLAANVVCARKKDGLVVMVL